MVRHSQRKVSNSMIGFLFPLAVLHLALNFAYTFTVWRYLIDWKLFLPRCDRLGNE